VQKISNWSGQVCRCVQEQYQWRHDRGLICEQTLVTARRRLEAHVHPFLHSLNGASPNEKEIVQFVGDLSRKGLSSPTCKQILFLTRKVVEQAKVSGLLASDDEAIRPRDYVGSRSVSRGGFRLNEYRIIVRAAQRLATQPRLIVHQPFSKNSPLPAEFPLLIRFMVNSSIRPTDLKNICHQHIQVIGGSRTYLKLSLPESKRHSGVIISMRPAVQIYESLKRIATERGLDQPEAPVFYPFVTDRQRAIMAMDRHFRRVLEQTGLRYGERGQVRTLYSLRHTAITLRLLLGEGIDLLTLAKNARTSVQMIERFYASELTPEMNVDLIQSRRTRRPVRR
jgi:hypothetical protein